jgi:hypothetical protein
VTHVAGWSGCLTHGLTITCCIPLLASAQIPHISQFIAWWTRKATVVVGIATGIALAKPNNPNANRHLTVVISVVHSSKGGDPRKAGATFDKIMSKTRQGRGPSIGDIDAAIGVR